MTPIYDDVAHTLGDPLDSEWFSRRIEAQLKELRDLLGVTAYDQSRAIAAALSCRPRPRPPVAVARTGRWRHARDSKKRPA